MANRSSLLRGAVLLAALTLIGLGPCPAPAMSVVGTAGQTDLLVADLLAPIGGVNPLFLPDGNGVNATLVAPANGYPSFLPAANGLVASTGATANVSPLSLFRPAQQTAGGDQFGNAASGIGGGIRAFGVQGRGPRGGVAWTPYQLADANNAGTASVVYSEYSALLRNGSGTFFGIPGVFILGVRGFIPNGSFVAASIRGNIDGLVQDVTIALDGFGGRAEIISANTAITFLDEQLVAGGTLFAAFGVSVVGPFAILPGSFHSVDATVSLVADPQAQIEFAPLPDALSDQLDALFPDGFISADSATAPDPPTLVLLALGALAGAVRRRRTR